MIFGGFLTGSVGESTVLKYLQGCYKGAKRAYEINVMIIKAIKPGMSIPASTTPPSSIISLESLLTTSNVLFLIAAFSWFYAHVYLKLLLVRVYLTGYSILPWQY